MAEVFRIARERIISLRPRISVEQGLGQGPEHDRGSRTGTRRGLDITADSIPPQPVQRCSSALPPWCHARGLTG
jgi:hypothetical protein